MATEEIAKVRTGLADPAKDRAKAIHDARQGFKRLRSLLRLAEPSLGLAFCDENRLWHDAGRQLSGPRDRTVLLESFDKIVSGYRGSLPEGELERLRSHLAANGADPRAFDVDAHVRIVLGLLDDAEKRVARLEWPADPGALAKGLKRSQSRLRKNWKTARKAAGPAALHDWRKRVKDQSAQLRLFRGAVPPGRRSRHGVEKRTAQLLGEEHDFWLLEEGLSADSCPIKAAETRDVLLGEIGERRRTLRNEALKLGRDFSSQKPKVFAREQTVAWEKTSARAGDKRRGEIGAISQAS